VTLNALGLSIRVHSNRDVFMSESNGTDGSDLHSEKQNSQITSTNEGMRIDVKALSRNAQPSHRDILVSESNVTNASNLHPEKQNSQIISTDEEM
jgi:hypothetical protein